MKKERQKRRRKSRRKKKLVQSSNLKSASVSYVHLMQTLRWKAKLVRVARSREERQHCKPPNRYTACSKHQQRPQHRTQRLNGWSQLKFEYGMYLSVWEAQREKQKILAISLSSHGSTFSSSPNPFAFFSFIRCLCVCTFFNTLAHLLWWVALSRNRFNHLCRYIHVNRDYVYTFVEPLGTKYISRCFQHLLGFLSRSKNVYNYGLAWSTFNCMRRGVDNCFTHWWSYWRRKQRQLQQIHRLWTVVW